MLITISKQERKLLLWREGRIILIAPVALGANPVGQKYGEGDGKTPEGMYRICTKNMQSRFYLSLGLSYPEKENAENAFNCGRIGYETYLQITESSTKQKRPPWNTPLGGFIMIHGEHPDSKTGDWTAGCIALQNRQMRTLFDLCAIDTPVHIFA